MKYTYLTLALCAAPFLAPSMHLPLLHEAGSAITHSLIEQIIDQCISNAQTPADAYACLAALLENDKLTASLQEKEICLALINLLQKKFPGDLPHFFSLPNNVGALVQKEYFKNIFPYDEARDKAAIMNLLRKGKDQLIGSMHYATFSDYVDHYTKAPSQAAVIYTHDNTFAGYICYGFEENECAIYQLAIEKNLQRRGYGKKLLQFVELEAKNNGTHNLVLNVFKSNKGAQSFYIANGFRSESYRDYIFSLSNFTLFQPYEFLIMIKDIKK